MQNYFYIKANGVYFYFTDLQRKSVIEDAIKQMISYMRKVTTDKQFDNHKGIQHLLKTVPELTASYQANVRENFVPDQHSPIRYM
jgi:hypothetical protein